MSFLSWFSDDSKQRAKAEAVRIAMLKAVGAAIEELTTFYDELHDVVLCFNQRHIMFGDQYMRLRFRLLPIEIPNDFRAQCERLKGCADLYRGPLKDVVADAEKFHDFVMFHNNDPLIRFLGYDNSVRKLMSTLDDVHLRQLVTLVSGGNEAGGSPLGVNALIHDFDNVEQEYSHIRKAEFLKLKSDLSALRLKNPLRR